MVRRGAGVGGAACSTGANVVVFQTLSKRSSMTGYRSGFVCAEADVIEALRSFRPNAGTAPQEFVQRASVAAWDDEAHVEETRERYASKRALLAPVLELARGLERGDVLPLVSRAGRRVVGGRWRRGCSSTASSSRRGRTSGRRARGMRGSRSFRRSTQCERAADDPARGPVSVEETIAALDRGEIRVAEKQDGEWVVNEEAKAAILEYFRVREIEPQELGLFEYRDKIPLKHGYEELGVRVVPPATARFGAFLSRDVILMPSYVNIGAWVGPRTMVDTWATVGSCAQIGADVHLAGGVGIGGVLEPVGARPVIVEDGAFIGSRAVIVEGVIVGEQAVIAPQVVLSATVPIIDVTGPRAGRASRLRAAALGRRAGDAAEGVPGRARTSSRAR